MSNDPLRRRALAEWRRLEEPRPKADRCASVAELLQKVMPKLGLGERLGEQQVSAAWREVVGEFLALHSLPVGLSAGVLTVQVVQPSVRYELDRSWKRDILNKLQERFGKSVVRDIRFRL